MKHITNVQNLPKGGPYSHSVEYQGLIFVSGQTGNSPGKRLSFQEQFENSIKKIKTILEANGSSLENMLKVTVYISDPSYFLEMNSLFSKYFGETPPARTTIVAAFVEKDVLVEIDAIASK
ncbi:MAG: RidA family protein [Candidatus Micrarchaeaceae archaeon]